MFGKDKKGKEAGEKKGKEQKMLTTTSKIQAQLLEELLQTKKGRFGDPEEKLRKDISKRLKVDEDEALKTINLMAYSKFNDVKEKLREIKGAKAPEKKGVKKAPEKVEKKEEVKKEPEPVQEAPPEEEEAAEEPQEAPAEEVKEVEAEAPVEEAAEVAPGPATEALLKDLTETKKGRFGNAEKKLKKDIKKRLKVPEEKALEPKNLEAYSRIPEVRKDLEKLWQEREKAAWKSKLDKEKGKEKYATIKEKVKEVKSVERPTEELADKSIKTSEVQERAQRVAEILEEQKRLDEEAAKKRVKKKKHNVLALPFVYVGRGISFVIGKIARAIAVLFITILTIPITIGRLFARAIGGLMQGVYKRAGRFSPFGWRKKINQLVIYSGITKTQEEITGLTIVNGVILAALVALGSYFLLGLDLITTIIASLASFGIVWVLVYAVINLLADKRTDEVESTLPDVLQIISANISAGMTPYNALWVSARKEFGALAEEIKIAQKETLGGKPFAESLTDMAHRVRSNILQRTIRLIIQGMKAGGELPNILQGIGADIRQMRLLQKEMAANTMSYTLFILFGMILGAPLLFSVSIQFVDVLNRFQPEDIDPEAMMSASGGGAAGVGGMSGFDMMAMGSGCPKDFDSDGIPDKFERSMGLDPKNESDASVVAPDDAKGRTHLQIFRETNAEDISASCITADYLKFFAMLALGSIAFFGSVLVGLIREGKQSAGLKYMPLLIPATIGMFMLINFGLSIFFKSMFA